MKSQISSPKQKPQNNTTSVQLRFLPIRLFVISEESMVPSLCPGDRVITSILPVLFGRLKINDIIVFRDRKTNRAFIKRIAQIKDDTLFVEGDNSEKSTDSRHFGPIQKSQVMGKVISKV